MHEQRGTFNGIDTCKTTSHRNFNFRSVLLRNAEATDINALLSQMVEEGTMSNFVAEGKRVHAQKKSVILILINMSKELRMYLLNMHY